MADERFDTLEVLQERLLEKRARSIPMPQGDSRAPGLHFDSVDVRDALPDAFMIRAGLQFPYGHRVHPLAEGVAELSFSRLGKLLQCRALGSSDFGSALAVGYRQIVASAYSQEDDCSAAVMDSVAGNYQPVAFPVVDTIDLQQVASTGSGIGNIGLQLLSSSPGESGKVLNYRARVLLSRDLLLGDDFTLVATLLRHLSAAAARLPGQRLGAILTANSNLADSAPLCGASNTTQGTGYGLTALAEAASLLRLAKSATGNTLNLKPAVWLVPALGEIPAIATVKLLELSNQAPIQVIINPWQPSGFSYLLAAPAQQPTFVRLLLDQPPLRPSVSQVELPAVYDGLGLDVDFNFGLQAVSRLGIVRIPVS